MTALVDLESGIRPTYDDITVAFKNLPKTSPLRNFLVVHFANHFLWYDEGFGIESHDGEVLKHLQHEALNMTNLGKQEDEDTCSCCHKKCNWHEHESLPEWKATCGDVWPKPRTLEPEEWCMRKTFPTYSTDGKSKKAMSFN